MSNYQNRTIFFLLTLSLFACKSADISNHKSLKVSFLSEYVLPEQILVDETLVGGLSGIDYYKDTYYLVCDDSNNPRI